LADIAHTAATGRSHFAHRLAAVAGSSAEMAAALAAFAEGQPG
jgi:acyl transferase domain-containing protein